MDTFTINSPEINQSQPATTNLLRWNGETFTLAAMSDDELEQLFLDIVDAGYDASTAPIAPEVFRAECTQAWQAVSLELSDRRCSETLVADDGTVWELELQGAA